MWQKLQPILKDYDAMICPTLAVPAVKADHDDSDPDFRINGKRLQAYVGWVMTHGFNLLSQLPVMSVPTGFSSYGVPTGMQIVGQPYQDSSVFKIASAFESETNPWNARPSI
ncbi:MAG: hypothetical protein CMM54_11845 [Rhodospirillaceae bacterium]|nr:hypothetical protein [Rhodospirillaceae bacterium]